MKAGSGKVISMRYTLTDDAGEVLDSNIDSEPLIYLHGHDNIVTGLEKALEGAETGFHDRVTVSPAEGYGAHDPKARFVEPRASFGNDMQLVPGMQVHADSDNGQISFTVVNITDAGVELDANHPLAGKTLHFDVEIIGVRNATREELAHGHVHTGHGHH